MNSILLLLVFSLTITVVFCENSVIFDNENQNSNISSGQCDFIVQVLLDNEASGFENVVIGDGTNNFTASEVSGTGPWNYTIVLSQDPTESLNFTLYVDEAIVNVEFPAVNCTQSPIQVQSLTAIDGQNSNQTSNSTCSFKASLVLIVPTNLDNPNENDIKVSSLTKPTLNATIESANISSDPNTVSFEISINIPISVINDLQVYLSSDPETPLEIVEDAMIDNFTCLGDGPTFESISVDNITKTTSNETCTFTYTVIYSLNNATAINATELTLTVTDIDVEASTFTLIEPNVNDTQVNYTATITTPIGVFNQNSSFVLKQSNNTIDAEFQVITCDDISETDTPTPTSTPTTTPTATPTTTPTSTPIDSSDSSASSITMYSSLSLIFVTLITLF